MPEQFPLPGFEAGPPTDRLFFALFPDTAAAGRIAQLAQSLRTQHGLKGKPLPAKRLHVTLHHLGDYAGLPEDIVVSASAAAATIAMPAFDLAFDCVKTFSGRARNRPLVLVGGDGVAAVAEFQHALASALEQAGLDRSPRAHYTPHVTLLYGNHLVAGQDIEPIAWTAREFVLVRSLIGLSQYVPLARWPIAINPA